MNTIAARPPAVFTVCNVAYLHKALLLADSLFRHDQLRLKIYLIDRRSDLGAVETPAELIWIEDVGVPELEHLAFKYDITEFSTAVKPFLALKLTDTHDAVVFLDPDTYVYSSIAPIVADLSEASILLTPHYCNPQDLQSADGDVGMMRFGSFNLGFFAVRRAEQGIKFLEWWWARCVANCYFETQFGLSTDQKWVSIAPCFFSDMKISRNMGYNMAFWNLHERELGKDAQGQYVVNGQDKLVFFHFSSFDEGEPGKVSKRPYPNKDKDRPDLRELCVQYGAEHAQRKKLTPKTPYGYDYLSDGAYVSPTLRRAYAAVERELPAGHDPFDAKGPVGAFARKNHLLQKGAATYAAAGVADLSSHQGVFNAIYKLMRLTLRVLGPNRFANLSRLFVYLSSYRQNRGLWRL
jgi:hypothetical protein